MRLDELEIRATLNLGDKVMAGFRGRYASLDHFFIEFPQESRIAVLVNGVGTGYFMFDPTDENKHLWKDNPGTQTCSISPCNRIVYALKMCEKHYRKQYRDNAKECNNVDCENKVYARGLCSKHYQQERRNGS